MGQNTTSSVDKPTSETSSRCLIECVTGAHNFEVTRFSLLQGMGAGKFVSSSTFSVSGYDWNIRVYPDGLKEDNPVYMSAFLRLCSGTTDVNVKCTFSLLEKDGRATNLESLTHTFQAVGGSWGWSKFIEKSKLQELLDRNDDRVTIRCVLTVIKEPRTEDVSMILVPVPQSDLHTHFANMLKDGEGVDVTFSVADQLFSAHRYVLAARSPVFKAELFGEMKETTMKCIKIDDMEPAIFGALLRFIYTDDFPDGCGVDKDAPLQHLFVAADRYGVERLKLMCQSKLSQSLDVDTVGFVLDLAERCNCCKLKAHCLRYIERNCNRWPAIEETQGFAQLKVNHPLLAQDILAKARRRSKNKRNRKKTGNKLQKK
jgi:speckle-type POZ protein